MLGHIGSLWGLKAQRLAIAYHIYQKVGKDELHTQRLEKFEFGDSRHAWTTMGDTRA